MPRLLNIPAHSQEIHELLLEHRIFLAQDKKYRPQHVVVYDDAVIEPYTGFFGGLGITSMGAFSYARGRVPVGMKIGRYCSIAPGLNFYSFNHPVSWVTTSIFSYERNGALVPAYLEDTPDANLPIRDAMALQKDLPILENDVWIGQNVTMAKGIRIGTGAVVAGNSVVVKDVPAYGIVGGNPAKLIRKRFSDDICAALLGLEWWRYQPKDFFHLTLEQPETFVKEFEKIVKNVEPFEPEVFKASRIADLM